MTQPLVQPFALHFPPFPNVAIVDASYRDGLAAWVCVIGHVATIRRGECRTSTEAELRAILLAIHSATSGPLEIRTDCEAAIRHITRQDTSTAQDIVETARHLQVEPEFTLVPREEVRSAHLSAHTHLQELHRRVMGPPLHAGSFSTTLAFPSTGGLAIDVPELGLHLTQALNKPLAVAILQLLGQLIAKTPAGVRLEVANVPERVQELWDRPALPWHPCRAFVQERHRQLIERGSTLVLT